MLQPFPEIDFCLILPFLNEEILMVLSAGDFLNCTSCTVQMRAALMLASAFCHFYFSPLLLHWSVFVTWVCCNQIQPPCCSQADESSLKFNAGTGHATAVGYFQRSRPHLCLSDIRTTAVGSDLLFLIWSRHIMSDYCVQLEVVGKWWPFLCWGI